MVLYIIPFIQHRFILINILAFFRMGLRQIIILPKSSHIQNMSSQVHEAHPYKYSMCTLISAS